MNYQEYAGKVQSRKDFAIFCQHILRDFQENGQNWENKTLGSFLEAMSAYATDIPGYYKNMGIAADANEPSWQIFAEIMCGAVVYE